MVTDPATDRRATAPERCPRCACRDLEPLEDEPSYCWCRACGWQGDRPTQTSATSPRKGPRMRTYLANLTHKQILVTTPACRSLDLIKMDGCLVPGAEHDWSRTNIAAWLRTHRAAGVLKRIA